MKLFSTAALVLLAVVATEARRGSNGHLQRRAKSSKSCSAKGKGGKSSRVTPPTPPAADADGCPCFTAADIDDYWCEFQSRYVGDNPCDKVEYVNEYVNDDGVEYESWYIKASEEPDVNGFEFWVEDDNGLGVCDVSKYFDPSVGQAKVERSFAGMEFDVGVKEDCIAEIKNSSMYSECGPFDD